MKESFLGGGGGRGTHPYKPYVKKGLRVKYQITADFSELIKHSGEPQR